MGSFNIKKTASGLISVKLKNLSIMKTWKFEVTLKVADSWVADGFDLCEKRVEEIKEQIQCLLPYAYGHEVQVDVKITKRPLGEQIYELQNGETEPKD